MFNKEIDVVTIMYQIRRSVVPQEISDDMAVCDSFADTKEQLDDIYTYMKDIQESIESNLNTGFLIPSFTRFPLPMRWGLKLIAKVTAKVTRFITREQNEVNYGLQCQISALLESHRVIVWTMDKMNRRYEKLDQQLKDLMEEKA